MQPGWPDGGSLGLAGGLLAASSVGAASLQAVDRGLTADVRLTHHECCASAATCGVLRAVVCSA
jgi:hypothetical protein